MNTLEKGDKATTTENAAGCIGSLYATNNEEQGIQFLEC